MTITTKWSIIAILWLTAMIIWSVVYGDDIKLARVDLEGFWQRQDDIATYWLNKCREEIGDIKGKYSCTNMILTFNAESPWRYELKESPTNKNGTKDFWYCQLNSKYHIDFIKSADFKDPYKQMDYCVSVWKDAKKKWSMPWYWFYKIDERNWYVYTDKATGKRMKVRKVKFINPPLSDKIAEPVANEPKLRLTGRKCRQIFTAKEWEVFQLDNKMGQFISWILGLKQGDKWFICNK